MAVRATDAGVRRFAAVAHIALQRIADEDARNEDATENHPIAA